MKTTAELIELIKLNHDRVHRIFSAVDFAKVPMTSQLIIDMNEFYIESNEVIREAEHGV